MSLEQLVLDFTPVVHGDFYRAQVCSQHNNRDFVVVKERLSRQGDVTFRTSEEVVFDKFDDESRNRQAAYRYCGKVKMEIEKRREYAT